MSHLPTERLAALADEQPTSEELAHLASCAACARERESYRSLLVLAEAEQARIGVPITSWDALKPALERDGIIDTGEWPQWAPEHRTTRWSATRRFLRIAAGLVLVAGGVAAGRVSAGESPLPWMGGDPVPSAATSGIRVDGDSMTFASYDEALAARRDAEQRYQAASAFLARFDTSTYGSESPAAIQTRLAALDRIGETMREALHEAPADPVINDYYLTTLGQREAAMRQLNTVVPASMRLNSF